MLGAGIGYLIEQEARKSEGTEYLIRMDDGRLVTLVQHRERNEQPIANDERVLVQYGANYTRVMPEPAPAAGRGRPGAWQNPDLVEPSQDQQWQDSNQGQHQDQQPYQ